MPESDHAAVLEPFDRRDVLGSAALLALALGACSRQEKSAAATGAGKSYPLGKPIKAAFINVGLANSWPAPGKPRPSSGPSGSASTSPGTTVG